MATTVPDSIHLLTVNIHALMRDAICALLAQQPGIKVLPQMPTCDTALFAGVGIEGDRPDLLLFDLDDCPHQHLECLAGLRANAATTRVLMLSDKRDVTRLRAAVGRGAHGVLMKTEDSGALIEAIRQIYQGRVWLNYEVVSQLIPDIWFAYQSRRSEAEAAQVSALTAREREVVVLLGEGLKYQEIADRLGSCVATVRSQMASATLKLRLKDRADLIVYAYRHGLVPLPFQNATERKDASNEGLRKKEQAATLYVAHRKSA